MSVDPVAVAQAERDAIAFLGLLSHMHVQFDPPILAPKESAPTHFNGLNIHGMAIDNEDGEVLAIDRNIIHASESPLDHGEQRVLRVAIERVKQKRPRDPDTTIEAYYRSEMFIQPGTAAEDFLRKGATLYTTLEPCPMCAATLLVARVKRVVFIVNDDKYGGAWIDLKKRFYEKDESTYGLLGISGGSELLETAARIHAEVLDRANALRASKVRDTHVFDHMRDLLETAFDQFAGLDASALVSIDPDRERNERTLADLKRLLNVPYTS
jgi:tRNA(Arg) A34 adenosine deaminase TadA